MATTRPTSKPSRQFWLLTFFLLLLFATGGSSRTDVQSLIILRPLSVIVCALAWMTLRRDHLAGRGWLLGWLGAIFGLTLLNVIPLPSAFWQSLAGRQYLVDVEELAGLSGILSPLTFAPMNGWHALISLFAPLAVLLLGIQLHRDDLFRLLPLVIALATLSGLIGLLQVISDPQGFLYFYRITNHGSAVGLFANRNHSATLLGLLFPMLAVYAATARGKDDAVRVRQWTSAVIAMVIIPLILVAGSRSGLLGAVIGLGMAALMYRHPGDKRNKRNEHPIKTRAVVLGVGVIGLAFLTYFSSRAEAFERLFAETSGENSRTDFWLVSLDLFWKHFPLGSGAGSFAVASQLVEPTRLLSPTYLNRAHNDWIETAVTYGLPGVVALLVMIITYCVRSYSLWRNVDGSKRAVVFGRLASAMVALVAVASVSDYPLRTPTMMGLLAICALWLTEAGRDRSSVTATWENES